MKHKKGMITPELSVKFDMTNGCLCVEGKSIPEDPVKVFQPLLEQVNEYCLHPQEKTLVELKCDYFNTTSMKWIFHILEKFETLHIYQKQNVEVKFYYSDENTLEMGRYLQVNLALPIDFIHNKDQ